LAIASQTAGQTVANGSDALQAKLASVMLDMLRMDTGVTTQGTRLTLSALRALVEGQRSMPGRKSVVYFTSGMYLTPELDAPLRHVNEEISSYYELSFNPGIQNYDGAFRKLAVTANRSDLVIHAREGYFALPPDTRGGAGLQPFEAALLEILSSGKTSDDVKF